MGINMFSYLLENKMILKLVARFLGIVAGIIGIINGILILKKIYQLKVLLQFANPWAIVIILFGAIGIPLIGIMGAALVKSKPLWGSSMMAVIGIFLLSSLFTENISPPYVLASGLFLVGAVLGIVSSF